MIPGGSFFFRAVAVFVLIALLLGVGSAVYQNGFSQGYLVASALEGRGTETEAGARGYLPYGPQYGPGWGWGFPRFGFFSFFPFLGCLFGLFLLFALGGLFRHGRFGPKGWGHHHGWGGGPHPHHPPEKNRQAEAPPQQGSYGPEQQGAYGSDQEEIL
jgi:hypothetical protein